MQEKNGSTPGAGFSEGFVEADGFRIRYMEAGQGPPLVHLHGAGGLRLTPAHDLLSQKFRVIAFEIPGFGQSPENTRTRDMAELALTMARAAATAVTSPSTANGTSRMRGSVPGTKVIMGWSDATWAPRRRSGASTSLVSAPLE